MKGRLPDALIVGVPKAATSALWFQLGKHPQIWAHPEKELHFFDERWDEGVGWYESQFASAEGDVVLEATPNYMLRPEWQARMATVVPGAKLIVCLRHPVDRAYSEYWMVQGRYPGWRSFEEVVEAELSGDEIPAPYRSVVGPGHYAKLLEGLTEHFSRSVIHVVLQDDVRSRAQEAYGRMLRFLGVDEAVGVPTIPRSNVGSRVRSPGLHRKMLRWQLFRRLPRFAATVDRLNRVSGYPPMAPSTRERLLEHYRPHNEALAGWLGRDLSQWNE